MVQKQKKEDLWLIEQETERLKREIDERNLVFRAQFRRKYEAARTIQEYFRAYRRRKQAKEQTLNIPMAEVNAMGYHEYLLGQELL